MTEDTPKLKPASENIWYALATVAGEWDGEYSQNWEETQKQNRHYWNGMMRRLIGEDRYAALKDDSAEPKDLPQLSETDLETIQAPVDESDLRRAFQNDEEIDFHQTELPDIDMRGFIFPVNADFGCTTFSGEANFREVTFYEFANFKDATCLGLTDFGHASFSGTALFYKTKFSAAIDFYQATFSDLARFHCANFSGWARFDGAKFSNSADFETSNFTSVLAFKNTEFLMYPPFFYGAKIAENVTWTDAIFPPTKGLSRFDADVHKDAYERLALMMDRLKKHHDQHRFFRLEMKARRAMETNPFLKLMNWSYEALADYGYGFGRALAIWLGHIGMGAALLFPYGETALSTPNLASVGTALKLWGTAFVTSFSNAHGFLGLNRTTLKETVTNYQQADLLIPYNVTATGQAILGVIFLFFLLLTARNRFRMG